MANAGLNLRIIVKIKFVNECIDKTLSTEPDGNSASYHDCLIIAVNSY